MLRENLRLEDLVGMNRRLLVGLISWFRQKVSIAEVQRLRDEVEDLRNEVAALKRQNEALRKAINVVAGWVRPANARDPWVQLADVFFNGREAK